MAIVDKGKELPLNQVKTSASASGAYSLLLPLLLCRKGWTSAKHIPYCSQRKQLGLSHSGPLQCCGSVVQCMLPMCPAASVLLRAYRQENLAHRFPWHDS